MAFHSDYLKDTGLLSAYQNFLKHLMNNMPKKETALEEASKFFSNYEKKYKPNTSAKPTLIVEDSPHLKKERKKIVLETKSRVFPSAPVITPQVFERQDRTRPLIGTYKTEPIQYSFNDIFDGKTVQLGEMLEDHKNSEKAESSQQDEKSRVFKDIQRKNSAESKVSLKSASSKRSKGSKKSLKSRQSHKSDKNRKKSDESDKNSESKNSGSDSGSSKS